MTANPPWYNAFADLAGRVIPVLRGLPSNQWENNPEYQKMRAEMEKLGRQRPDLNTEQGRVLSTVNQLARMQNDWQQDSNTTAIEFGDRTLDQYGRKLNMNLDATNAARDNFTGNTQKLESTQSSNRISEAEARARMSMMPVNAYADLVRDQEASGLKGLEATLRSQELLQREGNAAAGRRDAMGLLANAATAAAALFI